MTMRCGTCGSNTLRLWSTFSPEAGRCIWVAQCGGGHLLVPTLSSVYVFTFPDSFEDELRELLSGADE
jgi:hypothetical protein